ncbi:GNAT superfamily N-acetyltransferase [Caulobacter ginsengisoli]|uniref:GNAT superfamily N-acetyltransferase n=1 Tax=Caulobacter ginsengisoli TaxID=400775 RepID=A0ABU0IQ09_9CAUL|nr:GNAT family N-acetyltransferase [Caulobacter ginsengisoli]MDQ0464093.1 GNAT superfamily N-acetyltransferase [Caulobacter ginsengisoli]
MPTIRLAHLEDAAQLPQVETSAGARFREAPGLEWIADDEVTPAQAYPPFITDGAVWVAEEDGAILGFLLATPEGEALHVLELAVAHEAQGRGLGRALMAAAAAKARALGLKAVTLTTFRDLVWNEVFYRRLGYRTLAEGELDERLRGYLAREIERGLPGERRCAMRLDL